MTFFDETFSRHITQSVCVKLLTVLHFMQGVVVLAFPSHPDLHFTTFDVEGN